MDKRIRHITPIIWILLMVSTVFHAQAQFKYDRDHRHVNFGLGYYSTIDQPMNQTTFHHGFQFQVSYSVVNKYKIKKQKSTEYNRVVDRDIYVKVNLLTYRRKDIHQALVFQAGPAFRITLPEGIFFEFEGFSGYQRTFLAGDHFTVDGVSAEPTRALGSNSVVVGGNAYFGWNFYKSHDYPVFLFASGGIRADFPNNDKWLLQPVFQSGIGFVLNRIRDSYVD